MTVQASAEIERVTSGPVDSAQRAAALRAALALGDGDRLYAIADAARDMELAFASKLLHGCAMQMLLVADNAAALAHVAPYVIEIPRDNPYLRMWAEKLWTSAGILLTSPADMNALLEHLRDIFRVRTEEGRRYFFRFYDPRVLRAFLPTCTEEERGLFFGPIRTFAVEDAQPGALLLFGAAQPQPQRVILPTAGK